MGENSVLFLGHDLVDGNFSALEPLNKGDLGTVAHGHVEGVLGHFNVSLGVVDNRLNDLFDGVLVKLAVLKGVLAAVQLEFVLGEEADTAHILSSHRAGLAEADVSDETSLFDSVEVTDKHIIVLAHKEDGVSEGDSDGHGETLGDGNDKDDDRDDNVIDHLLGEDLSTNVFVGAGLDDKNDSRGGEDSDGTDKTKETQAAANVIKLAGELSVLLLGVVGSVVDTTGAMLSDGADEGLASAADNE